MYSPGLCSSASCLFFYEKTDPEGPSHTTRGAKITQLEPDQGFELTLVDNHCVINTLHFLMRNLRAERHVQPLSSRSMSLAYIVDSQLLPCYPPEFPPIPVGRPACSGVCVYKLSLTPTKPSTLNTQNPCVGSRGPFNEMCISFPLG